MRLYIAEKRDVGTAIKSALELHRPNMSFSDKGGFYLSSDGMDCVTYASGHMTRLLDPEEHDEKYKVWNLDHLPMTWPVKQVAMNDRKKQLETIRSLLKKASHVYNMCDIDGAGEAIFRNIYDYCQTKNTDQCVYRVNITDENSDKIIKAIDNPRPLSDFDGLYREELARSVGDQRLGYGFSRLFAVQMQKQGVRVSAPVGRVLNAIVGIVCLREKKRDSHTAEYYHNISADFQSNAGAVCAKFIVTDEHGLELDEKGRIYNENQATELVSRLNNAQFYVSNIKRKHCHDSPPLVFDLLSLQVQCKRMLGLSPDETLQITQELRTKYKAITYNRVDTRYLPDSEHTDAPEKLEALNSIPSFSFVSGICDPSIKSRCFNDAKVTAHFGIIPTANMSMYQEMPKTHKQVFALIARQYLIQFMPKRERIESQITFQTEMNGIQYQFKATTSRTIHSGWELMFSNDKQSEELGVKEESDDDSIDSGIDTSTISVGNPVEASITSKPMETKAPNSYTMTTLLQELKSTAKFLPDGWIKQSFLERDRELDNNELGGVGTPASRSDILKKAFANEYLTEEKGKGKNSLGKIVPTDKGWTMYKILPTEICSPVTTALWSHYFLQIKRDELQVEDFWDIVNNNIAEITDRVKADGLQLGDWGRQVEVQTKESTSNETAPCPTCSSEIKRIKGKFGFFWPCKPCETNFPDYKKAPLHKECPKCGKLLRVIKGKNKLSLGCKGFPDCKHIES